MKRTILAVTIVLTALAGCSTQSGSDQRPQATGSEPKEIIINRIAGFQDTPMQPGSKWHVHDPARPQPPVITPGKFSENAAPPSDAIVLFDGKDSSHWRDERTGGDAPWAINDGTMVSAKDNIVTTNQFGDMQLHLEFREPMPAKGEGQERGNSGVFLMGLYEIQVLDCYQNPTYADGATGAIYGQHPPLANACRPPGEWQTYDIIFEVPHFGANGKVTTPGYVTVIHNGVVVQNHQSIRGDTDWRSLGQYTPHGPTGPLALQFHNNAVTFRNIWVRPIRVVNEP
ncbi:MAG TPA: DUF1080 domain-containing protein [Candidatus Limnocylindrales bacterium]|nr:DUF1080 domain-containing protein [Candidatus Limnocylindrales bacterium]